MTTNNQQSTNWIRPPYAKNESATTQMQTRKKALDIHEEKNGRQPANIFEDFEQMYKEFKV